MNNKMDAQMDTQNTPEPFVSFAEQYKLGQANEQPIEQVKERPKRGFWMLIYLILTTPFVFVFHVVWYLTKEAVRGLLIRLWLVIIGLAGWGLTLYIKTQGFTNWH